MMRISLAAMLCLAAISAAHAQAPKGSILPGASSGGPISIDAGKLDYLDKEQKLVYSGGVTAKQGGSIMKASSVTIFMAQEAVKSGGPAATSPDSGAGQIRRMEAAGPVMICSQDQVGTGDRGFYERASNKVHLIGKVTLTRGPNVQKCDELIYDLSANRATCIGNVVALLVPGSQEPAKGGSCGR